MPKLPDNTVRFDSPLRRTSRTPSAPTTVPVVDETVDPLPSAVAEPAATTETFVQEAPVIELPRQRREPPAEATSTSGLEHRITVRIDDDINRALELERSERRLAGEKTNVADVARKVLAIWAKRRLARDRS